MSINFNPSQNPDTPPTLANSLVTQIDARINSRTERIKQQIASVIQSLQSQNQSLQAQAKSSKEQRQDQKEQNQQMIKCVRQLIVKQDHANQIHASNNETMAVINSYQLGTLNILNGIARILWPFGRGRPELSTHPVHLIIAPLPHSEVVIEEIPADADHPLPKAEETKTGAFIRFAQWVSNPIRWIFRMVISNLCKLAQKIGLIHGNSSRE